MVPKASSLNQSLNCQCIMSTTATVQGRGTCGPELSSSKISSGSQEEVWKEAWSFWKAMN